MSLARGKKVGELTKRIRRQQGEQAAQPVAWGEADAAGNIINTITPAEKEEFARSKWVEKYSEPLFAAAQPQQAAEGE